MAGPASAIREELIRLASRARRPAQRVTAQFCFTARTLNTLFTFRTDSCAVFAPRTTSDPDGTVAGYASLFGESDQARDIVMRGAFADSLASRGIRRIPMLFQHDPSEPVGIWVELREDFRGLFARGRLIPEVARGRELISLLRAGRSMAYLSAFAHPKRASIRRHASAACMRSTFGKFPSSLSRCSRERACAR